ncbi:hypothetical protein GGR44_000572 [Sphingobium fontiphilum]|uniref:DUF1795 domain-containing protein n=1 Tax=Sphingobium fontiphilum TaxID=944425 RepID=A0A7W6GM82_9SPHN|nr:hypothetical protein [Sphingobium fontiphilum]MBB3980941.1 hypothetical protein [Sphingobium fontiphilum]
MKKTKALSLAMATCCVIAAPAQAGWKLVPGGRPWPVGAAQVTPMSDWNQASAKPGKQGVAWTHDGFELNGLEIFVAVPSGQPLYRERSKKRNPMPKYQSSLLLPELSDFFERSFRTQYDVSDFTVKEASSGSLGGNPAVVLRYQYSVPGDELKREGVARLTAVNGKLYAVNFFAPTLHYFETGRTEAEAIMDSARF